MDLLEYQGKQLFARHDVPVPPRPPATTVEEAVAAADEIGYPCVVKAQVQIGGRGKAGGIKVANDRAEAEAHAEAILGMDIRGLTVHEMWIEAASDIAAEYYASIVFDRAAKRPLVMLSTQGGMDIEEVAERDPGAIARLHVDPLLGFQDFHARRLAFEAGVDGDVVRPIGALLSRLYDAFAAEEAMLVEVNPLIVTGDRDVMALDAKVTLDDSSLFRHPDNAALRDPSGEDPGRRGDPLERERHGRAVQHLRRHHALRRGRARADRGVSPDRAGRAVRRAAGRDERQGGPAAARRGRPAERAHGGDD